jgi:hypothetical protein
VLTQLMEPQLVTEFIRAFHERSTGRTVAADACVRAPGRTGTRLPEGAGLYEAIANALRTLGSRTAAGAREAPGRIGGADCTGTSRQCALIERIAVRDDSAGHNAELTGNIVKLLAPSWGKHS